MYFIIYLLIFILLFINYYILNMYVFIIIINI